MLIRDVKKQPEDSEVGFEGKIVSCKAPILEQGKYHQTVQLVDSSGKIWANFLLGQKLAPLVNGTIVIVKSADVTPEGIFVEEFSIPTTSEPPAGSPYEYNPAHPKDEMTPQDWKDKDMRMAKMCSLNNATNLVVCLAETFGTAQIAGVDTEHVKEVANEFLDWIYET